MARYAVFRTETVPEYTDGAEKLRLLRVIRSERSKEQLDAKLQQGDDLNTFTRVAAVGSRLYERLVGKVIDNVPARMAESIQA